MGSLTGFLIVYVLGGLTFIPLLFALIALHAYLTLPYPVQCTQNANGQKNDSLERPGDDENTLKTAAGNLEEKFRRSHESDVAAGYFTVSREYTPSWFNSKSPVQPVPSGEPTAAESASVYQTMYSSLFSRNQTSNSKRAKTTDKTETKTSNLFFVVLRHGHLMLYDDSEQIEVRYIISLAHYDVSIYSGGAEIPEEELWAKRNAIRLTRRSDSMLASQVPTFPFYIFSENLSEKEDLYLAMLRNKEKMAASADLSPAYIRYDARHIIHLLQRLYSSEEQRSTRWINAILGRLFLALYRTPEMEESVKRKIAKKISRAKTPNFITRLAVRNVNMGEGVPFINNPMLRELTLDGDCVVEMDFSYTGNFRLEVSATVHIDLGTRFKPRDVDLVLAVMINRVDGHCLVRLKPPPSNRVWFTFETMPTLTMAIEPIFGTRQITYGVVLRAIENRIREVISESIVLPFWDDIPFFDTSSHSFRGGIWKTRNLKAGMETNIQEVMGTDSGDRCKDSGRTSADDIDMGRKSTADTDGAIDPANSPSDAEGRSVSAHLQSQSGSNSLSPPLDTMDSFSSQIPSTPMSSDNASPVATGAAHVVGAEETEVPDVSLRHDSANTGYQETTATGKISSMNTPNSPETVNDDIARVSSVLCEDKVNESGLPVQSQSSGKRRLSLSTPNVENILTTPGVSELSSRRNAFGFLSSPPSTPLREKYQGIRFLRSATSMPRSWSWKNLTTNENMSKGDTRGGGISTDIKTIPKAYRKSQAVNEQPTSECQSPIRGTEPALVSLASDEYAASANEDLLEDESRLACDYNAIATQESKIHKDSRDKFDLRF
ncbi:hypothetical protein Plec18167_009465 [Paecilomyces lecythidis]|uniref:SMP-LTD domain-containing protein n=1 Tax=Paecilomyces lecythidis TaxID=3004212 RepID=A0ABR3WNN4_9EURO